MSDLPIDFAFDRSLESKRENLNAFDHQLTRRFYLGTHSEPAGLRVCHSRRKTTRQSALLDSVDSPGRRCDRLCRTREIDLEIEFFRISKLVSELLSNGLSVD